MNVVKICSTICFLSETQKNSTSNSYCNCTFKSPQKLLNQGTVNPQALDPAIIQFWTLLSKVTVHKHQISP